MERHRLRDSYVGLVWSVSRQLLTGRRPGGTPAISETVEGILALAASTHSDEDLLEQTRIVLMGTSPTAREHVLQRLRLHRDTYVGDRAYRLGAAVLTDTETPPQSPIVRALFEQERRLGTMSMEEAYEQLAALQPQLNDIRRAVASGNTSAVQQLEQINRLLGPDASTQVPIGRTRLAAIIAMEYVGILRGERSSVSDTTSYFALVAQRRYRRPG